MTPNRFYHCARCGRLLLTSDGGPTDHECTDRQNGEIE